MQLSPGKILSHLALSRVYVSMGQQLEREHERKNAGAAYRRSLELYPQNEEAQRASRSLWKLTLSPLENFALAQISDDLAGLLIDAAIGGNGDV